MRTVPSKLIKAADNMIFHANAMGNMCISIPNGERTSHVVLKDVLYCPDLTFTLVSLSQCDLAGYLALLKDQQCHICDSQGTTVGKVPLSGSLDMVMQTQSLTKTENTTRKSPIVDEFHHQKGHISPKA